MLGENMGHTDLQVLLCPIATVHFPTAATQILFGPQKDERPPSKRRTQHIPS